MREVYLDEISQIIPGYAFDSTLFNSGGNGMPIIRIRDIAKEASSTFTTQNYNTLHVINEGDFLIGMDGEFNLAKWKGKSSLLNQRVCKIIPNKNHVVPEYLYYFLPKELKKIEALTPYVTVKHISVKQIKKIKMPLQSHRIQQKIADVLNTADAMRNRNKEILKDYDRLEQSVFLDMFGDPSVKNEKYEITTIDKVIKVKGGKRLPTGEQLVSYNTGFPYIKAGNIKFGNVINDNLEYLTPTVREKIKRYIVKTGDVCITIVGVNIGDIGIVPTELNGANLTENAAKLEITNPKYLNNYFLAFYLMTDQVRALIKEKAMAAGVPKLALFRLKEIPLLLPPMEKQETFVKVIQKIQSHKKQVERDLIHSEELFQSLLQLAFKGELFKEE